MQRRIARVTALAGLLALTASSAGATTVMGVNQNELIQSAQNIVLGTIIAAEPQWQGHRIVTVYDVEVEELWKGKADRVLQVASLGGIVGEIGQHVAGMPHFQVGERVLLFLRRGLNEQWFTVGLWQGVYRLPARASSDVLLPTPAGDAHVVGDAAEPATSLKALRQRVRELSP